MSSHTTPVKPRSSGVDTPGTATPPGAVAIYPSLDAGPNSTSASPPLSTPSQPLLPDRPNLPPAHPLTSSATTTGTGSRRGSLMLSDASLLGLGSERSGGGSGGGSGSRRESVVAIELGTPARSRSTSQAEWGSTMGSSEALATRTATLTPEPPAPIVFTPAAKKSHASPPPGAMATPSSHASASPATTAVTRVFPAAAASSSSPPPPSQPAIESPPTSTSPDVDLTSSLLKAAKRKLSLQRQPSAPDLLESSWQHERNSSSSFSPPRGEGEGPHVHFTAAPPGGLTQPAGIIGGLPNSAGATSSDLSSMAMPSGLGPRGHSVPLRRTSSRSMDELDAELAMQEAAMAQAVMEAGGAGRETPSMWPGVQHSQPGLPLPSELGPVQSSYPPNSPPKYPGATPPPSLLQRGSSFLGRGGSPPAKKGLYEPLLASFTGSDGGSPFRGAGEELPSDFHAQRAAELATKSRRLGRRQLRAMLRKNWLLKKRNPGQFLCELISPLLMVMVLVGGWIFSLKHVIQYPSQSFANNTEVVQEVFDWIQQHIEPIPTVEGMEGSYYTPILQDSTTTPSLFEDHRRPTGDGWLDQWTAPPPSLSQEREEGITETSLDPIQTLHRRRLHQDKQTSAGWLQEEEEEEAEDEEEEESIDMLSPLSAFSALRTDDNYFPYSHHFRRGSRGRGGQKSSNSAEGGKSYLELQHDQPLLRGKALRSFNSLSDPSPTRKNETCFPLGDALPGKQFCYDSSDRSVVEAMLSYNGPTHIPRFDEFVTTHLVFRYLLNNLTDQVASLDIKENIDQLDQYTNGRLANLIWLGKLVFVPDTPEVHDLVEQLNRTHELFDYAFSGVMSDEQTAVDASLSNVHTDSDRTWAILVFHTVDLLNGHLEYSIRMNSSVMPNTKSIIDQFSPGVDDAYKRYYWSGFMTLQIMIEELVLNRSVSDVNWDTAFGEYGTPAHASFDASSLPPVNPSYSLFQSITGIPFPVFAYKGNKFYKNIGPLVGLVCCMSMLYPTSRLIKGIVEEKETKTKETMKMMGLKDWVFHTSWFLTFLLQFILISIGLALLLHFTMLPHVALGFLMVFFMLFGLSQISLGFLITVFFNKAKLAGILSPILLFASTMPRYAFFSRDASNTGQDSSESVVAKTVCSLLSPTAFTFGADLLVQYEGANLPFGWGEVNASADAFSMGRVLAFLLFDFVLYATLAWYLDQVMPNEYGGQRGVLFCCKRSYWKEEEEMDEEEEQEEEGKSSHTWSSSSASPLKKPRNSSSSDGSTVPAPLIEPIPPSLASKARVVIKNLKKQFTEGRGKHKKVTTAVQGLDLTLYEGQITALLGHNGAGKTTSISMLTGLISPSSGDCRIHGYSIRRHMNSIRKTLGVCPQQNVLWDKLTVREHLQLYATLKGVADAEVEAAVQRKIEEVGLLPKADIYSKALSGGMQRKLQCAMAFIGDSKVVFLDEPTSGMDPYSRRSTWELLRNAKKDRVIVLTTHFMDEADLLGDRIAIMSEGRLRCCGSSLFLKAQYGIGYNLTLVKASKKCRTEQVNKMVAFFCPEAKILSTAGGEMSYRLPWSSVSSFPGLFQQLEERRHDMGIGGYGISQTTLEEVFLRCAQLGPSGPSTSTATDIEDEESHHPFAALEEARQARKLSASSSSSSLTGSRHGSRPGSRRVSNASLMGHARNNSRPSTPIKQVVAGTSGSINSSSSGGANTSPSSGLPLSASSVVLAASSSSDPDDGSSPSPLVFGGRPHPTWSRQFYACLIKRYTCALRDLSGRFFEVVLPVLVMSLVLLILRLNTPVVDRDILMKAELYAGVESGYTPLLYAAHSMELEPGTLYSLAQARPEGAKPPKPVNALQLHTSSDGGSMYTSRPSSSSPLFTLESQNFTNSLQMSTSLLSTFKSHRGQRYGALIFNDTLYTHFNMSKLAPEEPYDPDVWFEVHPELTIMHNSSFFHSLPIMVAEVAQARWNANRWKVHQQKLLRGEVSASDPSPNQVIYQVRNNPLPLTENQSLRTKTYLTLFAALFMLIPFCYLPASFVLFVVKERSVKSKYLQLVSGLHPGVYWLSTYMWDLIQYTIVVISVMLVMVAFQNEQFVGSFSAAMGTLTLLLLYGVASIPLCYCYSFCFGNYTSAQVGIAGLNFLTGFLLVIASFMLDNITSTQVMNYNLKHIYRIFPSFALGEGLTNIATRDFFAFIHGTAIPSVWSWGVLGRIIFYLLVEAVVYMGLTLLLESDRGARIMRWMFNRSGENAADPGPTASSLKEEDEDVARERARCQKLRVKLMKPTPDGWSFLGLSSPVTPGYGLKGTRTPATNTQQAQVQDSWAITLNATQQPNEGVINSGSGEVEYSPSASPKWPTSAQTKTGEELEEPLLERRERAEPELSPQREGYQPPSIRSSAAATSSSSSPPQVFSFDKAATSSSSSQPSPPLILTPPPMERGESAETVGELPQFPMHGRSTTYSLDPITMSAANEEGVLHAHTADLEAGMEEEEEEEEDILLLQHLRKVYPARGGGNSKVTVAVENLSLGVPRGQVFGFLGINGAGKTTTMKMLTGDITISRGRAFIDGFSVLKQLPEVRKVIGVCPQVDPLLELMTAREQLYMYARFHGIPEEEIPELVQKLLDMLGLSRFADKQCGPYSGGNKRKLSLAIALIGDPSVVFLDEPSTGMDPVSRRFMWSVIESISAGRSVILTTHSMEECEALCGRIGIMVSGALQCLGSIQHLKSRFGGGYVMEINTQGEEMVSKVQSVISHKYPGSTLEEVHGVRLKYRLPSHSITLSSVFSFMEQNKKAWRITDYSISQCSLEQIFIEQVRKHSKKEGAAHNGLASP